MGSSPKPPPPPDPFATAQAQSGMNRDTALQTQLTNMTDQYTPDGSLKYKQIGKTSYKDSTGKTISMPRFAATQKLSAGQQELYDLGQSTEKNLATIGRDQSSRIGTLLATPLNFDNASALYDPQFQRLQAGDIQKLGNEDYTEGRKRVEDAMFARLNPQIDSQRSALETSLINKGLRPGSEAYDAALRNSEQAINDQRTSVLLAGGQEQSRLFGLDQSRLGFNNAATMGEYQFNNALEQQMYGNAMANRQQSIQEQLTQRETPINEISALMSGSQVSMPNFINTPQTQVAGTDYMGMVQSNYAQAMEAYKQQSADKAAMMGGLFGMAGTLGKGAMMMSDKRLKTDVERVGETDDGLGIYKYRFKGADKGTPKLFGLMAQEVEKVKPEAVATHSSGYKMVDYDKALGA